MRMIAGKVMMDRGAPEGLRDTPRAGYRREPGTARPLAWAGAARTTRSRRASPSPRPSAARGRGRARRANSRSATSRPISARTATRSRRSKAALSADAELHRHLRALRPAGAAHRCSAIASIWTTARSRRCRDAARSPCSARPPTCSSAPGCSTLRRLREPARPVRMRARDRCRRRDQLLDAANRRRGLQGAAAPAARTCRRSTPSSR